VPVELLVHVHLDEQGEPSYYYAFIADITERKAAEKALRESEELYRSLFENMLNGFAYCKMLFEDNQPQDFIYLSVNHSFEALTGLKNVEGKRVSEVIPGFRESDPELLATYGRVALTGKPERFETYVESLQMWFLVSVYSPEKEYFVAIFDVITERKQAEAALRESESRYRELVRNANSAIIRWKCDGTITFFNEYAQDFFGYSAEEVLGRQVSILVPERESTGGDLTGLSQNILEHPERYLNNVNENICRDGRRAWMVWTNKPILDDQGKVLEILAIGSDITERQRAEEALQASEAQYRLLAENVIDVIWTMDLNWKFTYASPSCESLSGYKDTEIVGMTLDQLLTPESMDLCEKTLANLLSPENLARQEYPSFTLPQLELRFKDGSRKVYIEVKGSFLKDSQQRPMGIVGVTRDISERKQLEEQFLQAQKMEAVGTLAGGIAHDFNNILTSILGNLGLAALDQDIGPAVQDRLTQAEAACLRAEALSRQLLTFAKGGAPVKKLFPVPELLTETTVFACVGSPVKCATAFPENLWSLEADPGQIGQVFQNLTINAIQAMPTGGTIEVWAENFTVGTQSDLPLSAGRYIKISVRDQGIGIPAEHLPRIFDPYFTTKHKGSGLGLASAFAIIKKHHGHIAVESKPAVGTTFTIYLPAVERQITPRPEEDRDLLVGTGKILLMDDEEMVRDVVGRMLARLGYEAEFAGDGGEAIAKFVQAQGSGQAFAGVILDLTVPGAMGGKETLAKLLEIDPQINAIVSSGYSDDPIMANFQKYGFSGVIAKPYKILELGKILHEVIMKKG
jgi:PAS domain S-box-containing protein